MPPAAILCYHSVTSDTLPSASGMNVPRSELLAAIELVRSMAEIVPLRVLVERHNAGRPTGGLAAVTFDDAYAALPLLIDADVRRAQVPVTIFVTTTATQSGARFWWDRTDDLFPRVSRERWRAFEQEIGITPAFRAGQPADLGPLRPLRQWVLATHQGRWPAALEGPLAALEQEHQFVTPHRAMTWEEVVAFANPELIDVGVHTVTHPVLPLLDDDAAVAEVRDAYRTIRERIPKAVAVLAIPFGLYDARTAPVARQAGMMTSLTLMNRSLRGVAREAPLPRFSMGKGLRRWKLMLRLALPRAAPRDYPALPSATS